MHQSVFSEKKGKSPDGWGDLDDEFRKTFDERTLAHLKGAFSSNFRAYNNSERPQKNVMIVQNKY